MSANAALLAALMPYATPHARKGPDGVYDELLNEPFQRRYPFCPSGLEGPDVVWCSVYDTQNERHFTRRCADIIWDLDKNSVSGDGIRVKSYRSIDLDGQEYDKVCPYFSNCALTLDMGKCRGGDYALSFKGMVGIITGFVPQDPTVLTPHRVYVTFNDGRTSYIFEQQHIKLEQKSHYEIWWVQRTRSEFIVLKKKGFNVTYPPCTYDSTYDQYFPYAKLRYGLTNSSEDGNQLYIDNSDG